MILGKHGGQEIGQPPDIYLLSVSIWTSRELKEMKEKIQIWKKEYTLRWVIPILFIQINKICIIYMQSEHNYISKK
jgi:hypothetical protein